MEHISLALYKSELRNVFDMFDVKRPAVEDLKVFVPAARGTPTFDTFDEKVYISYSGDTCVISDKYPEVGDHVMMIVADKWEEGHGIAFVSATLGSEVPSVFASLMAVSDTDRFNISWNNTRNYMEVNNPGWSESFAIIPRCS